MRARARKYEFYIPVYESNSVSDGFGGYTSEEKLLGNTYARIESNAVRTANTEGNVITSYKSDFYIRAQQSFDVSRITKLEFEGAQYKVNGYRDVDNSRKELLLNCELWQ